MRKEFQEMISLHSKILYKVGRTYCSTEDDFNDLQQEMMYQLWKSFASFRAESKQSTWIYRVCLNTAISFIKTEKKRKRNLLQYSFSRGQVNITLIRPRLSEAETRM